MPPAETFTCPTCGGTCHILQPPAPDDDVEPGDILAYRCADCDARHDVVAEEDDRDGA